MSSAAQPPRKRRLGEILQAAGVIDDLQLQAALSEQRKWGGKLGRTLVEMGFCDEDTMVTALSRQLGIPAIDLDRATFSPEVIGLLRGDVAERYGVFPVGGDPKQKILQVASSDPTNYEAIQELTFLLGQTIQISVASSSAIDRAIRFHYYGERTQNVSTATPEQLGMSEPTFDIEHQRTLQTPAPGPSAQVPAELVQQIEKLTRRVDELEKLSANQVRAIRGLLELLVDKGVVRREEYLAKVRGGQPG